MPRQFWFATTLLFFAGPLFADGPGDNLPDKVRRVPPPGIRIAKMDENELRDGLDQLAAEIAKLHSAYRSKAELDLLPDVEIFYKSAHDALTYDEFYDLKEVAIAKKHLQLGLERAKQLAEGKAPWTTATGLVVRGYKSKIDDSIQPYGLVVPATYDPKGSAKHRLDFWCHGRGEKLTELSFINGRLNSPGEFTPPNTIVLHLYGRYCCANKLAGEIDLFEAYESVNKHYRIDENRLVIRGFSMGGAACWQFAVHYPSFFCAAAPGAGFSETPEFLKVFQKEDVKPTWYEQKLWGWYDCPGYASNLFNLPTVAYSGEIDNQKQAADVMAKAFEREGMKLTHLIGPKTGHSYHKETKVELNKLIDAIAEKGRDPLPKEVHFATYTLRYNRSHWVVLELLQEHWEQARIVAKLEDGGVTVTTKNVRGFTLDFPAGKCPFKAGETPNVTIDGKKLQPYSPVAADGSWVAHFANVPREGWRRSASFVLAAIVKRPGFQGPIDDAFMSRFIMVAPTGKPLNEAVGKWVDAEMKHAIEHWRRQFRGEPIVKKDTEITPEDFRSANLILWGDPSSNAVIGKQLPLLPLRWSADKLQVADQTYDAGKHVPALIYYNAVNAKNYVVLNSGFTFREYDYLNNARQVPKLPDWAVIDITKPVTSRAPGGIVAAGFFDEMWKYRKPN